MHGCCNKLITEFEWRFELFRKRINFYGDLKAVNTNTFYRRDAETRGIHLCDTASLRLLYYLVETQRVASRLIQNLDLKG